MVVGQIMTKPSRMSMYQWTLSICVVLTGYSVCHAMVLPDRICVQICRDIRKCHLPKSLKLYGEMCCCQVNEVGIGILSLKEGFSTSCYKKRSRSKISENTKDQVKLGSTHTGISSGTGKLSTYADQQKNITLHTDLKNWMQALEACKIDGGTIVKIDSIQKHDYVGRLVMGKQDLVWIGLRDIYHNDTWFWTDGSPLTTPKKWNFFEPQNRKGEDCAGAGGGLLGLRAVWFDDLCTTPHQYICEHQKP